VAAVRCFEWPTAILRFAKPWKLKGYQVKLDEQEYHIRQLAKLVGILVHMVSDNPVSRPGGRV
jgi:hypothetical protein